MNSPSPSTGMIIYEDWRRRMMQVISLISIIAALVMSWRAALAQQLRSTPPYLHPILTVDTLGIKGTTRELATRVLVSETITELKEKNPILLAFQIDFRPFNIAFNNSGATSTLSENDASATNPTNTKKNLPSTMKATGTSTGIVFSSDTLVIYAVSRTLGSGFTVKTAHTKSNAIGVDIGNSDQKIFYFDVKTSPPSHVTQHLPGWPVELFPNANSKVTRDTSTVDGICIGMYEVTNAQFRDFLNKKTALKKDSLEQIAQTMLNWKSPYCHIEPDTSNPDSIKYIVSPAGLESHPVVEVTWQGADAFCNWLTETEGQKYRLPTEAEWLFAAMSDPSNRVRDRVFPGDTLIGKGNFDGIFGDDKWDRTAPVDEFERNAAGLFHFAGNVREWCEDWYQDEFKGDKPSAPSKPGLHVVRGGSWVLASKYARLNFRDGMHEDSSAFDIGFRVVIDHSKKQP